MFLTFQEYNPAANLVLNTFQNIKCQIHQFIPADRFSFLPPIVLSKLSKFVISGFCGQEKSERISPSSSSPTVSSKSSMLSGRLCPRTSVSPLPDLLRPGDPRSVWHPVCSPQSNPGWASRFRPWYLWIPFPGGSPLWKPSSGRRRFAWLSLSWSQSESLSPLFRHCTRSVLF